ncbi:MAG: MFS transporter [Microbacterium sp.]
MSDPQHRVPPWRLALSLHTILTQAVWFGVRLMVSYRAIESGADTAFIAVLAASLAAPALLAALPIGRLSDRFGGAILACVGTLMMIASTVAFVVVPGLPILLVASATLGLGNLAVVVGQQTFVAHRTRGSASDSGFGTLTAAASLGQLIGPPLVALTASATVFGAVPGGLNTIAGLAVAIVSGVLSMPCCLLLLRADREDSATVDRSIKPTSPLTLLATPGLWRSLVVSGLILVTMDLVYAFVPVWATEKDVDAVVVGWLLALRALVSVVSRFGLTRLVRTFGRKPLLLIAMGIGLVSLVALPFVDAWAAIGVMIGLGICLGLPQPLTMAWVINLTRRRDHGAALGLRMTANRFAQVTVPVVVGVAAAPLGVAGIFWANAVLLFVSSVLVAYSDPDAELDLEA